MRIGLIGNGTMGKLLQQRIPEQGHQLLAVFDRSNRLTADKLSAIDMLIDFSAAEAVHETVELACTEKIPLVTG
ncbi:MAG: NAD(P)-binding domain-containing protein, partial [Calditrichota bacterium]